jgi:hypothetical protein
MNVEGVKLSSLRILWKTEENVALFTFNNGLPTAKTTMIS